MAKIQPGPDNIAAKHHLCSPRKKLREFIYLLQINVRPKVFNRAHTGKTITYTRKPSFSGILKNAQMLKPLIEPEVVGKLLFAKGRN